VQIFLRFFRPAPLLRPLALAARSAVFPFAVAKVLLILILPKLFATFFTTHTATTAQHTEQQPQKPQKIFQHFSLATSQTSPKGLIAPMGGNHADEAKKTHT
ncbi:MAG: hypothetical protein MR678_07265, partial [Muribaculaceae bacterium]|nr:hypothetical protein [Muribaculaceae bacterium]